MSLIQIEKHKDGSFTLMSWGDNSDGSANVIRYETVDELLKVSPLLTKEIYSTSKDPDYIIIWSNVDGSINRIDCHIFSSSKDEVPEVFSVTPDKLDSKIITDFEVIKEDISVKFPKPVINPIDPIGI